VQRLAYFTLSGDSKVEMRQARTIYERNIAPSFEIYGQDENKRPDAVLFLSTIKITRRFTSIAVAAADVQDM